MKILLATAGSRGDVEPFVALARAATRAGHEAVVVAPRNAGVDLAGVRAHELDADYSALIRAQGLSGVAALRSLKSVVRPVMREVIVGSAQAALDENPDMLVFHPKVLSGPAIARALDIPAFVAELVPAVTPTRAFPAAGTVTASLGGALNRMTYAAGTAAASMFRSEMAQARALLGIGRFTPARPQSSLVPVSSHLLTRPADWPDTTHLTGSWGAASTQQAPPEVETFVQGGDVLFAGFGSMVADSPERLGEAIVVAARARGLRVLVATGLGAIEVPERLRGDDVMVVPSVPHDAVLPHVHAALHHGGVGTVHAVARAGVTSIIAPFFADQPFWGARLHNEGLAPAPIPAKRLRGETLEQALDAVPQYAPRNAELGPMIRAEDGTAAALRVLTQAARR